MRSLVDRVEEIRASWREEMQTFALPYRGKSRWCAGEPADSAIRDLLAYIAALEESLHARRAHPHFEYETTEGPRKAWDGHPPDGEGWISNEAAGGWERHDYHETREWMRPLNVVGVCSDGTVVTR